MKRQTVTTFALTLTTTTEDCIVGIALKCLYAANGSRPAWSRYANMIIRDVLEQVIEFIYLLKHTDLIEQFFGANINTGDLDEENLIDEYLQFGGKRYNGGRKRVFQMASSINENASVDNTLSLYDIYRILSEQCHNSYFLSTLDDIEEIETNKKAFALTEEQLTYLMIIISRFMEAYRK